MKNNCCIYKYTNLINNHVYIGQTNNYGRRIREHRNEMKNLNRYGFDSLLARAMRKYGEHNFKIEKLIDNLSADEANFFEKEFILKENSLAPNGYNILDGGKQNFSISKFSKDEIDEIKKDLIENKDYPYICNKWKISSTFVSNINHGFYFKSDDIEYPISKRQETVDSEKVQKAVYLLKRTKKTFNEIGKEVGYCKSQIVKINNGTYFCGASDVYPIRKSKAEIREEVFKLLTETNKSIKEISSITGASESTVRNILYGRYNKKENFNYPLR